MRSPGRHRITAREAVVLAAVGRRLSNAEIAAELVVSVRTVESHIASLRRTFAVTSRAELVRPAHDRRAASVPLPRDSFVGRDGDRQLVTALLGRSRVVTVTGPPGCGKTRLALELAAAGARTPVVVDLGPAAPRDVPTLQGADPQRRPRKNSDTSATSSPGSSIAAKWPPRPSTSVQRVIRCSASA